MGDSETTGPLPDGAVARLGNLAWRHADTVRGLVLADEDRVVVSCGGKHTRFWNARTGEVRQELVDHAQTITVTADGTHITTGGIHIELYDVGRGVQVIEVDCPGYEDWPHLGCYLPKRREIIGTTFDRNLVRWSVPDGEVLKKRFFARASCLVLHAESVIALTQSRQLVFCDVDTLAERRRVSSEVGGLPTALAHSGEPTPVLAVGTSTGKVQLLDADDGRELRQLESGFPSCKVTSLAFGRGGELLVAATLDGRLRLWDFADDSHHDLRPSRIAVAAVALSQDGRLLVAAVGSAIRRWRLGAAPESLDSDPGHLAGLRRMLFDSTGQRLATLAEDGVRIWSLPSREVRTSLPDPRAWP